MKVALRAVAQLADINVSVATKSVRRDPLFAEEIHIEEELINLEESLQSYQAAADSLAKYPDVRRHMLRERRIILRHCIGLTYRMLRGWRLPREYSEKDIEYAIRKLVRLVVDDAQKSRRRLDEEIIAVIKPFMSWRQRYAYRDWTFNPLDYIIPRAKPLYRRLAAVIPLL